MEPINRRRFIASASALSAITFLKPELVTGTNANSAINVGIVGCGNRGTEVLSNMVRETSARVVAMADLFDYQIKKAKPKFDKLNSDKKTSVVDPSKIYIGSRSWEKIMNDKDVDAILISSPAYTHPSFLDAAVTSGKHV